MGDAREARWLEVRRRVEEQIDRVAGVDDIEAYMICTAHAQVMARIMGSQAKSGEDLEGAVRSFWAAFIAEVMDAYGKRDGR